MALLRCAEKNVLPHLNFPLSEYGASKDKSMARIVRDVIKHFQRLRKALPQSVQKQLAEAEMALAANAGSRKTAKRSRQADEHQLPGAQQMGSTVAKPYIKRPAAELQPAADTDPDSSSDASDLPEGVVRNTEPPRPLKRLKRMSEMEHTSSQHAREADLPRSSATPQKPQQPEQPSVKVSAPEDAEKARLGANLHADGQTHKHGNLPDRGAQQAAEQASQVSEGSNERTWVRNRQSPAAASMQANGANASAAQLRTAVQGSEEKHIYGDSIAHHEKQPKQSNNMAPAAARTPKKMRAREQRAEPMEGSKRRKLEPFRPPGAPDVPARGRPTMQSLLFASQPVRPSSAQAAPSAATIDKPKCPACSPLAEPATSVGHPEMSRLPPQQMANVREVHSAASPSEPQKPSGDSSPATSAQQVKVEPTAEIKESDSAQGKAAAHVISLKLGSLQRPDQPHGSAPSSREYVFSGRAAATNAPSVQQAAGNAASAGDLNAGEDTDWSTDGQQSADQADACADVQLGSSGHGTDAAGSAQLPFHSNDSRGKPSRLQHVGVADHADEIGPTGKTATPAEHQCADAAFSSPPPPVRTLEDDLAEQGLPGRRAATAAQRVDLETSAAPSQQGMPQHSLQPDHPGEAVKAEQPGQQAQGPADNEALSSGIAVNRGMPEIHQAAGTVADPVVITDSDSSEDELEVSNFTSHHCNSIQAYKWEEVLLQCVRRVHSHEGSHSDCLPHLRSICSGE